MLAATVDDLKTAVMDIYSALNVIYEGCPAKTRRFVFEQARIVARRESAASPCECCGRVHGRQPGGPNAWEDFTLPELRAIAVSLRLRHEKAAV